MAEYTLFVYCRRNGVSRDGGLHATESFPNDTDAIIGMREIARNDLSHHYDEIGITIKEGDRVVNTSSLYR